MKYIKTLVLTCFCIIILLFTEETVWADPQVEGSGTGDNAQAGIAGFEGGFNTRNSGWLVYIVEGNHNEPIGNAVQRSDTIVFYSTSARPEPGTDFVKYTRFGKEIPEGAWATDLQSTWGMPIEERGNQCIGRGGIAKNLMVNGMYADILKKYFNEDDEDFYKEFDTKEYYLIYEPFYWHGVYLNKKFTGQHYCSTSYGWAKLYKEAEILSSTYQYGDPVLRRYTHNICPNGVKLEFPMWDLILCSGLSTNSLYLASGNGFFTTWVETPHPTPEEPPVEEELIKTLYETRNWSEEFNISQSIPSGEMVKNEIKADTFYGSIKYKTQISDVKHYSATNTYEWTETEYHDPVYDKKGTLITPGWEEEIPCSTSRSISFAATVKYQTIDEIEINAYDAISVKNKAFGEYPYYDERLCENYPEVVAEVIRYTGDNVYPADNIVHGYTQIPNSHYYMPDGIPNRTIHVDSAGDVSSAHSSAVAEMKAYVYSNSYSLNDKVRINVTVGDQQKSYVFMDNVPVTGCIIHGSYNTCAAQSDYRYGGMGVTLEDVKPIRVEEQCEIQIPPSTDNNDYPTGMQVFYKNICSTKDTIDKTMFTGRYWYDHGDSIYEHIIEGALDNTEFDEKDYPDGDGYPVKVHTPVISPIMITDAYSVAQIKADEQLVDIDGDAQFQLKLDSYYMVKWNPDKWLSAIWGDEEGYGDSGTPNKYDEYVMRKEVKFPFDVFYNGAFYKADTWIVVEEPTSYLQEWNEGISYLDYESKNHWAMTPFYIPSYAEEGSGNIEAKVYAYNTYGRYDGVHDEQISVEMNSNQSEYVATYSVTDQLSGHIYGFSVTGVDDTDMYDYIDLEQELADRIEYPLASVKEEKIAGKYNRFGSESYRYLLDGSLTSSIEDYNLLPLRAGSNATAGTHTGDGRLWMGTGFSFNVKTIANLSGDNDYIQITPTFKIYDTSGNLKYVYRPDGTLQANNDVVVLFHDKHDGKDLKIFGGPLDNITRTATLGNRLFNGSYYTQLNTLEGNITYRYGDWVNYTLNRWNRVYGLNGTNQKTEYDMMQGSYPCYTNSLIKLDKNLRMLSGEYEQLMKNRRKTGSELITYNDWDEDDVTDGGIGSNEVTMFRDSMQSWYGYYCMPGILYFYDGSWASLESKDSFSIQDDFLRSDDIGDIVINFDIVAYKNGQPHLQYGGMMNGGRVWEKEGYNTQNGKYNWGDVVTYDSQKRWADKMQGYAIMIN